MFQNCRVAEPHEFDLGYDQGNGAVADQVSGMGRDLSVDIAPVEQRRDGCGRVAIGKQIVYEALQTFRFSDHGSQHVPGNRIGPLPRRAEQSLSSFPAGFCISSSHNRRHLAHLRQVLHFELPDAQLRGAACGPNRIHG